MALDPTAGASVPVASVPDTLRVLGRVLLPTLARGVIVRRPPVVAAAEKLDTDRFAVQTMQRLHERYGAGPLLLRTPVRRFALVLDPDDVSTVLDGSPDPFAADSAEKRAALSHFQPGGALIASGDRRPKARRLNEQALDHGDPVHHLAARFLPKLREEAEELATFVGATGELDWDDFVAAWFRAVRRVVFGDGARHDDRLTDLLHELRADANWSALKPKRRRVRARFHRRLAAHLDRAEPGSLAALLREQPEAAEIDPVQQIPQWLFAFDPAGMAAFRALALLAAHPDQAQRAREEVTAVDLDRPQQLPFLRGTVLESLRLWPTTPAILRDTVRDTTWRGGTLPEGSSVVVYAPYFHRDDRSLSQAHRFDPDLWLAPRDADAWPLVPFSDGPVVCPGRHLVLLTTSTFLATLLDRLEVRLPDGGRLDRDGRLPSVLDPFHLAFEVRRWPAAAAAG
ncbi:cytochrome P450 [Nitriliruptoraceae bacterium ZYF776]|nr:cytochrome P450 [Profundirhabdus halotolerans]